MAFTLENDELRVSLRAEGAELTSLQYLPLELEYLWQADPGVWGRHAPVLFPFVGRLKDDAYRFQGKSYAMGQHGFARDCTFDLVRQTQDAIWWELTDAAETRQRYPFAFRLRIGYELSGLTLRVNYEVHNPDEAAPLHFSIGAHPGFRVPLQPEVETYDDYHLRFEQAETQPTHRLQGGLFDGSTEPMLVQTRKLPLSHELFADDALVFHELESSWVELRSLVTGAGLRLHSPGWPSYGIWAKPEGNFVCLEPWYGHADHLEVSGALTKKPGILSLPAGQTWQASYAMEVFPPEQR